MVADILGIKVGICLGGYLATEESIKYTPWSAKRYSPSTDWSQGGPINEREIDCIRKRSKAEEADLAHPNPNFKFKAEIFANINGYFCGHGPTPLIAAMRCYVASKLGDEIEIPIDLL